MGRKALLAVLCWITLNEASAKAVQTAYGVGYIDNISAESAPQLYRNVPVGAAVYASANPYAAYSFHIPQFVPNNKNIIPVKEERILAQSTNNFLKDSYGQRYVEAPQTFGYKAALPQQFVPLQNLPAHLSQPLVAAAPNAQYGQATHFFGPAPIRLADLQSFSSDRVNPFVAAQPLVYAGNVRAFAASPASNQQVNGHPVAQLQSTNNKNVYTNSLSLQQYNNLQTEPKVQIIQQEPKISASDNKQKQQKIVQKLPLVNAPKETTYTTITNGKKTVVSLITKPPVPLLDLTLLEPLTFDNPLVPQVQHFLPRIHQVKYKKLNDGNQVNQVSKHQKVYMVQNTKTYDSAVIKKKPKSKSSKKKQKKQPPINTNDGIELSEAPIVTVSGSPNGSPEISYEINSPNYKETYSEKKISYNKETQSQPVHISYEKKTQMKPVTYSYGQHTEKEPVHYNYVRTSKMPAQIKQVPYENNNENPKHLIYHFKPEENTNQQHEPRPNSAPQSDSIETFDEITNEEPHPQHQQIHNNAQLELAEEAPQDVNTESERKEEIYHQNAKEDPQPEHREVYHENTNDDEPEHRGHAYESSKEVPPEALQDSPESVVHNSAQQAEQQFKAKIPEYEEDITILPTHKPHSHGHAAVNDFRDTNQRQNSHPVQHNEQVHYNDPESHYSYPPAEQKKSNRIIIKEDSPQEVYTPNEELMAAMEKKQEESEEDFEKAYKNAAYGFPAYDSPPRNVEKEIYDPANYGAPRYYNDLDLEKSPLRQYEAAGDVYPSHMRSQYKDSRDKTNENYYTDYAVRRPERLIERYKQKEDYYNNYMEHRPDKYFAKEDQDKKQSAKYIVYGHTGPQQKQQLASYKAAPKFQEYSYTREAPHDSFAYATRPLHTYKSKTQFVEPQFQYGFEPLTVPLLLDSELAAMASNDSPESKTLGTRKKVYKENFVIKKYSTEKSGNVSS